jgi:DNA polymerase elongation subunit (family B)
MILDRTWNKRDHKLTISYIDKDGGRKFYTKYFSFIRSYEYDPDGDCETWDGKRCRAVMKDTSNYKPNDFDILEHLYELPEDLLKAMHAQYFPKVYTWDIETEYANEFPYPDKAKFKVTAISLVGPDLSCIVFGLKEMGPDKMETFRNRYLEFIDNNEFAKHTLAGRTPKVLYRKFDTESEMLKHWWTCIVPKIGVMAAWNAYGFDIQYMVNRTINLFGKVFAYSLFRKASPTGELSSVTYVNFQDRIHITVPAHSVQIDYMEVIKEYDYVLRPYESYSLDWVSNRAFGANKVKYEGGLQQLYERDYEWYYYYNAVDSLLVQLIHQKLRPFESPCAVSSVTLVPVLKAFGQVALTTANLFKEFYDDGKHVVYDFDAVERVKIPYDGAFCGCVTEHENGWGHAQDAEEDTGLTEAYRTGPDGRPEKYVKKIGRPVHTGMWCDFNVCDDFASLYPSQIITCNFSFENILTKTVPNNVEGFPPVKVSWTPEELDRFRADPGYFVSLNGNVYRNDKDYAFKRMQARTKNDRGVYKYLAQKLDSEVITEIDRLLKEKGGAS